MNIKSVKDTIFQSLPGELAGNPLPFWIKDGSGKTGFQVLTSEFLHRYQEELEREKAAVEQGVISDRNRKTDIQQALDCLQTPDWRPVLAKDAAANEKIIDELLKEREEYEQFLKQTMEQATKTKSITSNSILKDICELIEVVSTYYITITTDTIRRFRAQKAALINVDALDDASIASKIGNKQKLLLSQLSNVEKSIADRESTLLAINEALIKTKQAEC